MNIVNTEFSSVEVWFAYQVSKEIENWNKKTMSLKSNIMSVWR